MNNRDLRNRHAFEEKKPSSGNLSSNDESSGRSIDRGKNPEGSRRCPEDACVIVGGPRQCKILSTHTNDKEKKNKKKRYRSTISQLQLQLTTGVPLQRVKQKRYPAEQCSLEAFLSLYLVFSLIVFRLSSHIFVSSATIDFRRQHMSPRGREMSPREKFLFSNWGGKRMPCFWSLIMGYKGIKHSSFIYSKFLDTRMGTIEKAEKRLKLRKDWGFQILITLNLIIMNMGILDAFWDNSDSGLILFLEHV